MNSCHASSILFVDDEPHVLDGFRRMLRPFSKQWDIQYLSDSLAACAVIRNKLVDVVVTDVNMPRLTGIELVERLQQHDETRNIPVIVVTGNLECDLKRRALDAGATDLMNKPVQQEELVARLRSSLRLKACYNELQSRNLHLEDRVQERTRQLRDSRLEIIARLGKAAEFRDTDTGRHVLRVAHYSRLIAQALSLPSHDVETIFAAAPLHDVGKIAVPDAILYKPGPLTDAERRMMQEHCRIGEKILGAEVNFWLSGLQLQGDSTRLCQELGNDSVLETARRIAATHHEHWDGRGYPAGLAGEAIPLSGRIVALADVFDALTTTRPYKRAHSTDEALRIIADGVGSQFDPKVHEAFLSVLPQVEEMRLLLADGIPASGGMPASEDHRNAEELKELTSFVAS